MRSTRPSSTPATTVAHAPVPQASVRPAPRSHTTMRTWLRLNTCGKTMLGSQTGCPLTCDKPVQRKQLAATPSSRPHLHELCVGARGEGLVPLKVRAKRGQVHIIDLHVARDSPSFLSTGGYPEVRWQQRLGAGDACRAARAFTSASTEPKVTACGLPMLTQVISHSRPDTGSGPRTTVLPCATSGRTLH